MQLATCNLQPATCNLPRSFDAIGATFPDTTCVRPDIQTTSSALQAKRTCAELSTNRRDATEKRANTCTIDRRRATPVDPGRLLVSRKSTTQSDPFPTDHSLFFWENFLTHHRARYNFLLQTADNRHVTARDAATPAMRSTSTPGEGLRDGPQRKIQAPTMAFNCMPF